MQDWQLLQKYAREGSQDAFAELVRRHVDFVYSVALGEVRDAHLAEDVAQIVFIILARKAPSMREGTVLAGWLFNTARFASRNVLKQEARRVRREQKAAEVMVWETHSHDVNWDNVEPHLHRALAGLRKQERNVVLLRFWEGKSVRETAAILGVSEQATRMRANRALDKLRRYFSRHGFVVSTTFLSALIVERVVRAAPPHCRALAMRGSALAATSASVGELVGAQILSTVQGTVKTMFIAQVKSVALTSLGLAVVGIGAGGVLHSALASAARPAQPSAKRAALAAPTPKHVKLAPRARLLPRPVTVRRIRHITPKLLPVAAPPVRFAQAVSEQPAISSAPATVPPTQEFPVAAGEIRLDGRLTAIDVEHKSLLLQAAYFMLPNGKATRLDPPKAKPVLVDGKTSIYVRGHRDQIVTLSDLQANVSAIVVGKDLGSGKPLPAREVVVWDTQRAGDFSLKDYPPRRPDRAAPTLPVPPDVVVAPDGAVLASVAPPAPPPPNRLVPVTRSPIPDGRFDGTFEKVTAAGQPVGWRPFGPKMSIEEENGNHFLRLTNRDPAGAVQTHAFLKLDPAWKLVRVQARMRARGLVIGPQVWDDARLGFTLVDVQGRMMGDYPWIIPHLDRDADWTTVQGLWRVPPGATLITLDPSLMHATGTVDFDDIEVIGNPPLSTHTVTPGLPEGTFEDLDNSGMAIGWTPNSRRNGQIVAEGTAPQPVNHFLRVTNEDVHGQSYVDCYFKLNPDWQAIQVSTRMRAQHLQPGKEGWQTAHLAFSYVDTFNNRVGDYQLEPSLHADSDWVTLKGKSTVPRGAVYIKLSPCLQYATGSADFDDVLVEEAKAPGGPSLPLRPGFPEGKFEDLAANGSPAGWTIAMPQQAHVLTEDGNHFLRLTSQNATNSVSVHGRFRLPAAWPAVRVRARLRASNLTAGPNPADHPQLRIIFEDNQGARTGRVPPPLELKRNSDWVTVETKTLVPDDASIIRLVPILQNCAGTFDIDDIEVEPLTVNAGEQ